MIRCIRCNGVDNETYPDDLRCHCEDHPLMRSPQPCDVCHRHHLHTEPCLVLAKCVQCGGPVGYVYRGEEGHAECRHCIREGEL